MKKIAVYNIKGGDGKTTTAKTISVGLSKKGNKVLLCDADGQANTSKTFVDQITEHDLSVYDGLSVKASELNFIDKYIHQNHGRTISEVFNNPKSIKEVIHKTKYTNLDVLPSDLTLYLTDTSLRLQDGARENKIQRATNFIKDEYDYMIFDCSPVKSLVSVNILYTQPLVIIPVSPFDDSMQGLALTINEINQMMSLYDELEIDYRILIVKHRNINECKDNEKEIKAAFGNKVLNTVIGNQAKPLEKAAKERKSIFELPNSKISDDYLCLIEELKELI